MKLYCNGNSGHSAPKSIPENPGYTPAHPERTTLCPEEKSVEGKDDILGEQSYFKKLLAFAFLNY